MKFAFSTVACPAWDFEALAARAGEYGYDGVEVRGSLNESSQTESDIFLTSPAKVRKAFDEQGIAIACVGSPIAMTGDKRRDAQAADDLRIFIDTAAALDARLVRISDTPVRAGQDRAAAAVALAQWLLPLGDYAAQRDVMIVVENRRSVGAARDMWTMLEIVNHPSVACCWDIFTATLSGESPSISVPVLNSRIQYAQVKDAKLSAQGATACPLGQGDVPVEKFLTRLRGIGYEGWVTLEWDKARLPNLAAPEDVLPDAIKKLREWTQPQLAAPQKARAKR